MRPLSDAFRSGKKNAFMSQGYHKPVHVLAVILACGVFPLVIVGAGVTSKGAGMAYPDWPTSGGHLVNPPHWWQVDATRWEHGHRLIGWCVGLLAIASAGLGWRRGGSRRWLTLGTLGAISVQGVMGGLRVREISTGLAMVHGIWGQVCFCLACVTALCCSKSWFAPPRSVAAPAERLLRRVCVLTTFALFIQLVLGAALRHFGGDTALIAHLLGAVAVSLLVGWVVLWVIGNYPDRDLVELLGWLLGLTMVLQLVFGGVALVVTYMAPAPRGVLYWLVPSAHVAVGTLLLACSVLLTLCLHRRKQPDTPATLPAADFSPAATPL